MDAHRVSRRKFLIGASVGGGSLLLASCTGGRGGPSPTVSAGTPSGEEFGGLPLGTLEGPAIVTDPALFPTTFQEAPELAKLVEAGKLPPVTERLGKDPLVIKPVHEVGKYMEGASIRRGNIAPDTFAAIRMGDGPTTPLATDHLGTKLTPNIAKAWEKNEDATEWVIHLREGMRWSDGEPFTADDWMFWYEDVWLLRDEIGVSSDGFMVNGKSLTMERIDDYTIRYAAPEPFGLFEWLYLVWEPQWWNYYAQGAYFPKHYLQQFHPKYVGEAKAKQLAQEAGTNDWVENVFQRKSDLMENADVPVIMPWKVVKGNEGATGHLKLERNPYSIWVDTDGNQLPYIGEIEFFNAGDVEALHLSQMAGEYDLQEDVLSPDKLPLLLENQERGDYVVRLAPGERVDLGVAINSSYVDDPEIGELLRTAEFRQALSMAIDRDQLNEAIFLGLARPSGYGPSPDNRYYPGDEWGMKWATLDVDAANELLDGLGLTMASDGYRERRDGNGRLRLNFAARQEGSIDFVAAGEMIGQHFKEIGIDLNVQSMTETLLVKRAQANMVHLTGISVGSPEPFADSILLFATYPGETTGAAFGVEHARWYWTNGKEGTEPYPELLELYELFKEGKNAVGDDERTEIGKQWWREAIDRCLHIGCVAGTLADYGIYCARPNMGNVPDRFVNLGIGTAYPLWNAWPQTFYYQ